MEHWSKYTVVTNTGHSIVTPPPKQSHLSFYSENREAQTWAFPGTSKAYDHEQLRERSIRGCLIQTEMRFLQHNSCKAQTHMMIEFQR